MKKWNDWILFRYHHLQRDSVDEKDYPPSQEYFLYADNQVYIQCTLYNVYIYRNYFEFENFLVHKNETGGLITILHFNTN